MAVRVFRATLTLLLATSVLANATVAAEQPARVTVSPMETRAFPELGTTVVVTNSVGVPIIGLKQQDFELVEDGKSVPILALEQQAANRPGDIAVVLGLDVSGSMQGQPVADAVGAIQTFIDRLGPNDLAAGLSFGGRCSVDAGVGLTTDKGAVKQFFSGAVGVGDTPFYDAALVAVERALGGPAGRRMVVLLTDGEDTCSKTSVDTVREAALRHGVPLHIIGLGPDLKADLLRHLATISGGQYFAAEDSSKLAGVYEALQTRLRTQYVLRYKSGQLADDKEHVLSVRVKTEAGEAAGEARFKPPIIKPVRLKLSITDGQEIDGRTRVEVSTSDPVQLVRADFYLDDTLLQSVAAPPLIHVLDPAGLSAGNHTLRVHAVDFLGTEAETAISVIFPPTCLFGLPCWSVLAAVMLLPILAVVIPFVALGQRKARCPVCRRKLQPGWSACPYHRKPQPAAQQAR
jgi:VWFA-related protein